MTEDPFDVNMLLSMRSELKTIWDQYDQMLYDFLCTNYTANMSKHNKLYIELGRLALKINRLTRRLHEHCSAGIRKLSQDRLYFLDGKMGWLTNETQTRLKRRHAKSLDVHFITPDIWDLYAVRLPI